MKWLEAFYRNLDKPSWTNREASGVIGFARAAVKKFGPQPNVSLTPWDWYAYSLPALGWEKPGDKFKVDTKQQLLKYPAFTQLRASLVTLASELDEAGIPFAVIVDPRGTDKGFRQLALDAWDAMKNLGKGAQVPPLLGQQWEKQLGPELAAQVASSADPNAAAAAHPKAEEAAKQLDDAKQRQQLPVIQPVDKPITVAPELEAGAKNESKSGGAWWLLLLLFAGKKRKKRGGRR